MSVDFDVRGQVMDFSLEEVLLIWIMDWYFDQKQWFNKTPE